MPSTPPLAPVDVARIEETRIAAALAGCALEHEPFAGGVMAYGGPGSWQNGAYGAGLAGPVDDAAIDRCCAFYRSRGCEPRIELAPFAHPSLVEGLAARGFVIQHFENVLYRELSAGEDLRALLPHGWPHDPDGRPLEIRKVDPADDAALRLHTAVAGSGFRAGGTPPTEIEVATARRVARNPRTELYLAWFGDTPVAGGSAELHPNVATLFGLSTLPAFRRRGVQAALIAARLERARAAGISLATIGSEPGISTERNAMRLGFRVAYTKVVLRKPEPGLARSP